MGRGFLLFLIQCQITVLLPGPEEDHRPGKCFKSQSFQESDCHSSSPPLKTPNYTYLKNKQEYSEKW